MTSANCGQIARNCGVFMAAERTDKKKRHPRKDGSLSIKMMRFMF